MNLLCGTGNFGGAGNFCGTGDLVRRQRPLWCRRPLQRQRRRRGRMTPP